MIIATSETSVDLKWVCDETALIFLDEHVDDETVKVVDVRGKVLFVVSFRTLKVLRAIALAPCKLTSDEFLRMAAFARMRPDEYALHLAQVAAGGNPG